MINKMTLLQAFRAMICFLDIHYSKTLSDDLGSLLGDIQLSEDGVTWDPTAWNDWVVACEKRESITPQEAFKAVFNFLNAYYVRTSCSSSDIKSLLDDMVCDRDDTLLQSRVWNIWIECVRKNT